MKVLMIIDMQKGFINENNQFLVDNINNLIKSNKFDKIIATKFINNGENYKKLLNWDEMKTSPQTDIVIDLPKNAIIINKSSYGLPLEFLHLDEKGRIKFNDFFLSPKDEIYLVGTDSDACVLAVAFQLFDDGFAPKFIIDSIGSSSKRSISSCEFKTILERNFGKKSIINDVD